MRTFVVATALSTALSAAPAYAGQQEQITYCNRNADGSGECQGNFLAFRSSSDPTALAYFWTWLGGSMGFVANYGGTYYSCVPQAGTAVANHWSQLLDNRGFFYVIWNSYGICTNVYIRNASLDSDY